MKTALFLDKYSTAKWMLYLSILAAAYWLVSNVFNIYHYPAAGAIFEILWLPMVALLFIIPVIALLIIFRTGTRKMLPVISLTLVALVFLMFLLGKQNQ